MSLDTGVRHCHGLNSAGDRSPLAVGFSAALANTGPQGECLTEVKGWEMLGRLGLLASCSATRLGLNQPRLHPWAGKRLARIEPY